MNITNGNYRFGDNFGKLFDIYIKECNPKNKQKAQFGRLLGFDNYSHMKKELGYWTDENLPKIESSVLKTNIPQLIKAFVEIRFSTLESKSLKDCLELLLSTGELTSSDLEEYKSNGLTTNISLSLKQVIKDELSYTNIENIKLTQEEEVYFINHHWESLPEVTKQSIINEKNINHLDAFALKVITMDILAVYKKKESLVKNYSNKVSNEIESKLLLCHKVLFKKNIVSCELLFNSIKEIFSQCYSGTEHHIYVQYAELIEAINKDDKKVMSFYSQNCNKHDLNSDEPERDYGFDYNYGRNKPKKVLISSILRSKSPLASPVLASYILHSLGDSTFDIERLYACLYVIQKEPALIELSRTFEPLERINDTLTYTCDDLNNDIISVYVLSQRVQNLKTKDGVNNYIEILNELNNAGNYYLVLTQACRFIQLGALLIENNVFSNPFKYALSNASISDIEALDELEIEAVCYFAKKENISSGILAIYTSEEMLNNSKFLSEDWIKPLVSNYHKKAEILRDYFQRTNQNREAYHHNYHTNHNDNFIWMLKVCSSEITTEQISFAINKKIASAFSSSENHHRRNSQCGSHTESLTKNHLKIIEMFQGYDNENYIWLSLEQVLALDFFIKNKILNKKDILVKDRDNTVSTIIDKTLHVFFSIDTHVLTEYILKYNIENIVYYHSASISDKYKDDVYKYQAPVIGKKGTLSKVTISNISQDTMEKINKLSNHIKKLNIAKFEGSNPVNKLAERLAPKFYFMNKEFNQKGKSYQ
jgi:hypothetical protein